MTARRAARGGFTLVEVLISVAILCALSAATAMAIGASARAFEGNLAHAEMLQHARNALMRMSAELRTGSAHLPTTPGKQTTFAAGIAVTDAGVTFVDEGGRQITYKFDAAAKTLTLKVDSAAAAVLARGVDTFSVRLVPARSKQAVKTGGIHDELQRATLTLTLRPVDQYADFGEALTLSQSVAPRGRLWD